MTSFYNINALMYYWHLLYIYIEHIYKYYSYINAIKILQILQSGTYFWATGTYVWNIFITSMHLFKNNK